MNIKELVSKINENAVKNAIDGKAIGTIVVYAEYFVEATTKNPEEKWDILKTPVKLSGKYDVMPFLSFDAKTGKITGHEGRHRAGSLFQAKGRNAKIEIALYPEPKHREWKEDLSEIPTWLKGQFTGDNVIKLDKKKIKLIKQNISGYDANSGKKV